ncbi:MAG TPA: murein biosynthesis integral membrane protein MurJ, partial [Tepidisphaeraceae bacterium]|nr:murein biosynthesis integral membrane protein MurJ [Tepidisphaeraceae bacterium]
MDVQAQPTPEAPPPQTSPSAPLHYAPPAAPPAPNFIAHAKLIGAFTLLSRLLGMAREVIAARFFGAGVVWSAFQYAFTIPNLFRKLLGEGALSAAFIPLYAKALKDEQTPGDANNFAAASVSLLISILIGITLIGEAILVAVLFLADLEPGTLLAVKLTVLMLPYVVFVCAAAFVGGILQVHRRFTAPAVIPVVSNLLMIVALAAVALTYDLTSDAGQTAAVWWVAIAVLVSGVVQLIVLWPALRTVGFRFRFVGHFWTPAVKKMLLLSIPVALGAGVLQIGVVVDKQIALLLAPQSATHTTFEFFGQTVPLPMESGALARLNWAQFLYQFPLGVFAISLATAIFPQLSGDALDADRTTFRNITRRGLEASLFIGLPASVGMAVVATPAVRLLFEGGQFTAHDSLLTARSTAIYASAIWAFSILQVLNRAFYALHDMRTPLIAAALNLLVNLIVEIPLLWTPLGESAMAAGTAVSFALQALFMLWLLRRRLGPLGLSRSLAPITKMLIATAAMGLACWLLTTLPAY